MRIGDANRGEQGRNKKMSTLSSLPHPISPLLFSSLRLRNFYLCQRLRLNFSLHTVISVEKKMCRCRGARASCHVSWLHTNLHQNVLSNALSILSSSWWKKSGSCATMRMQYWSKSAKREREVRGGSREEGGERRGEGEEGDGKDERREGIGRRRQREYSREESWKFVSFRTVMTVKSVFLPGVIHKFEHQRCVGWCFRL